MEEGFGHHDNMLPNENKKSTTVAPSLPPVTARGKPSTRVGLCGYVVAPANPAFRALAVAQNAASDTRAASPRELGRLDAPPETFDESDDERLTGLDLPARCIAHDERGRETSHDAITQIPVHRGSRQEPRAPLTPVDRAP